MGKLNINLDRYLHLSRGSVRFRNLLTDFETLKLAEKDYIDKCSDLDKCLSKSPRPTNIGPNEDQFFARLHYFEAERSLESSLKDFIKSVINEE